VKLRLHNVQVQPRDNNYCFPNNRNIASLQNLKLFTFMNYGKTLYIKVI